MNLCIGIKFSEIYAQTPILHVVLQKTLLAYLPGPFSDIRIFTVDDEWSCAHTAAELEHGKPVGPDQERKQDSCSHHDDYFTRLQIKEPWMASLTCQSSIYTEIMGGVIRTHIVDSHVKGQMLTHGMKKN